MPRFTIRRRWTNIDRLTQFQSKEIIMPGRQPILRSSSVTPNAQAIFGALHSENQFARDMMDSENATSIALYDRFEILGHKRQKTGNSFTVMDLS
jgi:hypothetical protein